MALHSPLLPKVVLDTGRGWMGTLPELPMVTGIVQLIQAVLSKNGFLFWVENPNHLCGFPEPGRPLLLSHLVRVALL